MKFNGLLKLTRWQYGMFILILGACPIMVAYAGQCEDGSNDNVYLNVTNSKYSTHPLYVLLPHQTSGDGPINVSNFTQQSVDGHTAYVLPKGTQSGTLAFCSDSKSNAQGDVTFANYAPGSQSSIIAAILNYESLYRSTHACTTTDAKVMACASSINSTDGTYNLTCDCVFYGSD